MGLTFRKSIRLGKNVKLNLSKSGPSLSVGPKGAKLNINKNGVRGTLRKNGVQYTKYQKWDDNKKLNNINNNVGSLPTQQNNQSAALTYRGCPIDNKEGKIPYPRSLKIQFIAMIASLLFGFAFVPLFVLVPILSIVFLINTLTNKQMRAKNEQFYAIRAYHFSKFDECMAHCNKSLKYKWYESTSRLLNDAKNRIE